MPWLWLRLARVTMRVSWASPVVEVAAAGPEMIEVLAELAKAKAELRAVRQRKNWGEELRQAEAKKRDTEMRIRAIRRRQLSNCSGAFQTNGMGGENGS